MQRQNMTIVGCATLYFVVVTLDSLLKNLHLLSVVISKKW